MDLLYDGKAEEFIDNLKGLKFRKKKRAATLKKMRYDEYRNKGYQIDSGVIESSCKHVVGAGMR
ncbi:MAG: hypothetical protein PHT73_00935 [bacterium]|nr:hypothetical protein [bacterium]